MRLLLLSIPVLSLLYLAACRQAIVDQTDQTVYRTILDRQRGAVGEVSDANVGIESGEVVTEERLYEFVPRPREAGLPDSFQTPRARAESPKDGDDSEAPVEESASEEDAPLSKDVFSPQDRKRLLVYGLREILTYATRQSRELQDAKEDLYLAALDLTLERHLWTPQFVASVQADFADFGQVRKFDRAMSAVGDVAVSQRLPYGGDVTARLISTLMRDLGRHITSGETGSMILEASIPLFRGAGRVAYESRYQAERELIYAVRTFERFRRAFIVRVAAEYFDLQERKAAIDNAHNSYISRREDWRKADFINRMGRSKTVFDATRARSSLRSAEADLVSAKEAYASAVDRFKIVIGMSVDQPLDVIGQDEDVDSRAAEALLPDVGEKAAVAVALDYRLDLLTNADRVEDASRGVYVAKNRILPDLDLTGSVTLATDENRKNTASYNTERATWRAGLNLRMDDRYTERNDYRAALIGLRRAQRSHEEFIDTVRADVRRALRRIDQQESLRAIQAMNVEENRLRVEAARAQFDLGKASNQDVVDAEDDLLSALNRLSSAVSAYRNAILVFRLDTGTLRISDAGQWETPGLFEQPPSAAESSAIYP